MLIRSAISNGKEIVPGLLLVLVIAVAASRIGHLVPIVGGPISAILIGILIRLLIGLPSRTQTGVTFSGKRLLQLAIILLGAGLSLKTVWTTGSQSFVVMICSLLIALVGGSLIGKLLRLPGNIITLITVGTSVCGASAISAVSPIISAAESEITYSISTIFFFNIIAVFLFPLIGHIFHFSSQQFGLWAGTAINDTSSVVAAGYSFSHAAGQYATIVKLTRSLAIVPLSLLFAVKSVLRRDTTTSARKIRFPLFIIGFILMSALDTFGVFGSMGGTDISKAGQFLIVVALAGIGLSTNFKEISKTGFRPMIMGFMTWALVAVSSLILQRMTS